MDITLEVVVVDANLTLGGVGSLNWDHPDNYTLINRVQFNDQHIGSPQGFVL